MLTRFSTAVAMLKSMIVTQLAQHDLAALGRTAQQRLERAAFLLAGAQIDRRIEGAGQRPEQQHDRQDLRPEGDAGVAGLVGHVGGVHARTAGRPSAGMPAAVRFACRPLPPSAATRRTAGRT